VSLNIKNERVHAMAREAAERLGTTQTGAIEEALRRLLAQGTETRRARIDVILADMRARIGEAPLDTDELYDEGGLPR
jgi:antitoxin VapB